jgi:flagellar protein FlaI
MLKIFSKGVRNTNNIKDRGGKIGINKELKVLTVSNIEDLCLEVLRKYSIGSAQVIICIDKQGVARYLINEPPVNDEIRHLYNILMEALYTSYISFDLLDDIGKILEVIAKELNVYESFRRYYDTIMYYIYRDVKGYGVLDVVIKDKDVEDIELSYWEKPVTVVHKDFLSYEALVTNIQFQSMDEARALIERIAIKSGKSISIKKPELHALLPEGFRVAATLGEPISAGPTLDIRKLNEIPIDAITLIKQGVVDAKVAALVWLVNDAKLFYVIVGGSGSGKTTILNAFLQLSNPNWKIIVVQDVPEIKLPLRPRFIQFFGEDSEEMLQRCFTALRYRPDMLVVGEVRGKEITALVRAVASGSGSATTFHASTPEEYEMAVRGLLSQDLYTMLSLNTALLIFVSRIRRGYRVERKVLKVYERVGNEWREIFSVDKGDEIIKSYTLKRLSKRLLREDIEAEYEYRLKVIESMSPGYESVERILKRFYGL